MEDFAPDGTSYIHTSIRWKHAIIELEEVMVLLKYKDVRSVLKWCKKHKVFVLNQGNAQVVNHIEFVLAFYRPYMEHLKQTKENWKELFVDYVCGNVINILGGEKVKSRDPDQDSEVIRSSRRKSAFLEKVKNL